MAIKKTIIYTNKDNQDFEIKPYTNTSTIGYSLLLNISNGCNALFFNSSEEVDEFCALLNEVKKEIWG